MRWKVLGVTFYDDGASLHMVKLTDNGDLTTLAMDWPVQFGLDWLPQIGHTVWMDVEKEERSDARDC